MKTKVFAVLALFSVVSAATYAQQIVPGKSISIWAGLSLSSITTPDEIKDLPDIDIGYRSGFNIRASVFLPISGRLGTRLGLGWIQKGWTLDVDVPELPGYDDDYYDDYYDYYDDASIRSRARVNYLSAPALLQFNPTSSVHLLAGPVFSFALGCSFAATLEVDGAVTERDSADCDDEDVDLDLRTVDISIMVGAGVNIPVSSALSVSLEAVFDLGVTDFSKVYGDEGSKNKSFGITAGVNLQLGR